MGSILGLLANPAVIQIALTLLELFAKKNGANSDSQALFLKMAEMLRALGAKEVRSSFESEERQDSEINQAWKDEAKKP